MAPNISVPMNFGIRLLNSPTHSTLQLKANKGAVVRASSVILSFNSPVIDHMTTTLHLTSVDMEEFSEEAVRYFVDAAYTGKTPTITRELFRDINKIANVFKMSWLVTRCVEQFTEISEAINEPVHEDLVYLFEEAAFVLSNLKSRQLVSIALSKIRSLNGGQDVIKKYLEDFNSLTCQQLDLIIELAGPAIHHIVLPLTEQLALQISRQETIIPVNCKYLIENVDLSSCQEEVFDQFFDVLEKLSESQEDLQWAFKLYRRSAKNSPAAAKSAIPGTSSNCVVQYDDDSVVPNLFHTLDCSLTFPGGVIDWLATSEKVVNLLMFFEGLWTWMWFNKNTRVECTTHILNAICTIKRIRNWRGIHKDYLDFEQLSVNSKAFFEKIKECEDLCTSEVDSTPEFDCACIDLVSCGLTDVYITIDNIFTPETTLKCYFMHPAIKECSRPGECGFILKTIATKEGTKMVLCTDSIHYSESDIHYHSEVKAKNLHFAATYDDNTGPVGFPLSWCGRPVSRNGEVDWSLLPARKKIDPHTCYLCVVFTNLV